MAVINGTQAGENLGGTNDADVITGFAGDDVINGAPGNDSIDGGAGNDNIDGGEGDDIITVAQAADLGTSTIAGGAGSDTLVSGLADGDDLIEAAGTETLWGVAGVELIEAAGTETLWGVAGVELNTVEFVQVSNASNFMLDLSNDAIFAFDQTLTTADTAAVAATDVDAETYTASSGAVAGNGFVADENKGITIGGTTYVDGDSFESTLGGTVNVAWDAGTLNWTLAYTPAATSLYAVGVTADSTDDVLDQALVATIYDANGTTADVSVTLALNLNENFDATAATAGITSKGDTQANNMTGSAFNDVIWAGAGDAENDTIDGLAGDDILAGGGGTDTVDGGAGADTIYGGAGADDLDGDAGDDVIWAGEGNDSAVDGGTGNDTIGGGAGADTLNGEDGDDVLFAGSDVANDSLAGGAGADTIYAGAGEDTIAGGNGDDLIFNGGGSDTIDGGAGADTIWGGAGNDQINAANDDGDDVFAFVAGNGNDTISFFDLESAVTGETGDVLDLSAFGFADTAAVLDATSDVGGIATIALAPGQTITLTNLTTAQLQAATDDWVMV
ncbi:calcium-binding protein [Donghicola sp. XS_ASV15]|uniref:calcium-binding protein n=1 Tax=Donghicola sp. XS_ASV15 TaxID=3241295 RepID=UPI003519BE97